MTSRNLPEDIIAWMCNDAGMTLFIATLFLRVKDFKNMFFGEKCMEYETTCIFEKRSESL
jgi:hypothetical protein